MGKKKNKESQEEKNPEIGVKKEEKTFAIKAPIEITEKLFKPQEWAKNKGMNPLLFIKWKDSEPISEKEFDELKKQVI